MYGEQRKLYCKPPRGKMRKDEAANQSRELETCHWKDDEAFINQLPVVEYFATRKIL